MRKTAIHKKIDSFGEMKQWRGKGSPFGAHLKVLKGLIDPLKEGREHATLVQMVKCWWLPSHGQTTSLNEHTKIRSNSQTVTRHSQSPTC